MDSAALGVILKGIEQCLIAPVTMKHNFQSDLGIVALETQEALVGLQCANRFELAEFPLDAFSRVIRHKYAQELTECFAGASDVELRGRLLPGGGALALVVFGDDLRASAPQGAKPGPVKHIRGHARLGQIGWMDQNQGGTFSSGLGALRKQLERFGDLRNAGPQALARAFDRVGVHA